MPADKKIVAIGGGAALIGLLAFLSSGGTAEAAPEALPVKPKKPPTDKERAVALAVKFARLFGIPPSLVLAIMAINGWRRSISIPNSRGGAWGITTMTVATAADLTKRFPAQAKKYWPRFNGTGQSLQDLATDIALAAWQLSLQWKFFKRQWLPVALAYYTGSGRMQVILKSGGGKLPATLPADVAREAAAYKRVMVSDPIVKRSLANDPALSGALPAAARKRQGTLANAKVFGERFKTIAQCRQALGAASVVLNKAYPVADRTPFIASWAGLEEALHQRIDSVNTFAMKTYKEVSALKSDPPPEKLRTATALAVLQANDALADVDDAVNDPELQFLPNFLGAIREILEAVGRAAQAVMPSWAPWAAGGALLVGGMVIAIKH
jgi:hypothetical protein